MRKKRSKNDSISYYIIYPVFGERSNIAKIQYLLPKDNIIVFHKIKETELKNTQNNILSSATLITGPYPYFKVSLLGVKLVSSQETLITTT